MAIDLMGSIIPFSTPSRSTFSSLTSLCIRVQNLPGATLLLKHSTFPRITTLEFELDRIHATSSSETRGLVDDIIAACPANTLENLCLYFQPRDEDDDDFFMPEDAEPIQPDALRPLLKFTRMRKLELFLGWSWDLDNQLIHDMVVAWPDIVFLVLDPSRWWARRKRITIQGLEVLATRCPNLTTFGAVIDDTLPQSITSSTTVLTNGVSKSKLHTLDLGDSWISESAQTAAYLSSLFPELRETSSFYTHEWIDDDREQFRDSSRRRWEEVAELVPVMTEIREEERQSFAAQQEAMQL